MSTYIMNGASGYFYGPPWNTSPPRMCKITDLQNPGDLIMWEPDQNIDSGCYGDGSNFPAFLILLMPTKVSVDFTATTAALYWGRWSGIFYEYDELRQDKLQPRPEHTVVEPQICQRALIQKIRLCDLPCSRQH